MYLFKEGYGDWVGRPEQDWFLSPVTPRLCIVWGRHSYSHHFSPLCSSCLAALQHLSSWLDYIPRSGPKYVSSAYCWAPTGFKTVKPSFFLLFPHSSSLPFPPTLPSSHFMANSWQKRIDHVVHKLHKINTRIIMNQRYPTEWKCFFSRSI